MRRRTLGVRVHPCTSFFLAGTRGVPACVPVTSVDDRTGNGPFDESCSLCCVAPFQSSDLALELDSLPVTRRFHLFLLEVFGFAKIFFPFDFRLTEENFLLVKQVFGFFPKNSALVGDPLVATEF